MSTVNGKNLRNIIIIEQAKTFFFLKCSHWFVMAKTINACFDPSVMMVVLPFSPKK